MRTKGNYQLFFNINSKTPKLFPLQLLSQQFLPRRMHRLSSPTLYDPLNFSMYRYLKSSSNKPRVDAAVAQNANLTPKETSFITFDFRLSTLKNLHLIWCCKTWKYINDSPYICQNSMRSALSLPFYNAQRERELFGLSS